MKTLKAPSSGSAQQNISTTEAAPSNTPTSQTSGANSSQSSIQQNSSQIQQNSSQLEQLHQRRNTVPSVSYPLLKMGNSGSSVLRLQQLLAQLGYLPVTWHANRAQPLTEIRELTAITEPPKGSFSWTSQPVRQHLQSLWNPVRYTVITKGAVMDFESVHGLAADGIAGPKVWSALLQAALKKRDNPSGYTYVYVSKSLPEQLTLWHNGTVAVTSLANTGIAASPTPSGTWPVYLRYRSQTMSGTDPSGTHYVDKGVPYVNYFYHSDAVHGFLRASYGWPQSLGCVELPYSKAQAVWQYMTLGTLVTVGA